MTPDRRTFLKSALGAACCAAASPFVTPVALAAAPGDNRLVVVILRGAMDGLGVFAPYEDPMLRRLRPRTLRAPGDGMVDLDGRFAMDDRLAPLLPLWKAGEFAFAHAVSTPYRDKRSHFDGQDILEAGVPAGAATRDGWLNRALSHMGVSSAEYALSVGRERMLLMAGDAPTRSWSPGAELTLQNDERGLLEMIYAADPLFAEAASSAAALSPLGGGPRGGTSEAIAAYAGKRLAAEARIAAFSINGWDTHANQHSAINRPLRELAQALLTLKRTLGPEWSRTMVVAMTEFGRTARENGAKGTDHGTGGAAILAGGALKGGKVYGEWPGLGEQQLYQGRDLMPTADVRRYPAWALAALFGLPRAALERDVFPGLDMGGDPRFVA